METEVNFDREDLSVFDIPTVLLYSLTKGLAPLLYSHDLDATPVVKFTTLKEILNEKSERQQETKQLYEYTNFKLKSGKEYISSKYSIDVDTPTKIEYQITINDDIFTYQLNGRSKNMTEKEIKEISNDLEFVKNNNLRIKKFIDFCRPLSSTDPSSYVFAIRELVKLSEFLDIYDTYGDNEPDPEFKEEFFDILLGLERIYRTTKKDLVTVKTGPFELLYNHPKTRYSRYGAGTEERFITSLMRIRVGSVVIYNECGLEKFKHIKHPGLNVIINYCWATKNKKRENFYAMISKRVIELF